MDALFYPTLSLPGPEWTNPNLLYFDQIGVIAPAGDERELFNGPTRRLIAYGLAKAVEPIRYANDDAGDERLVGHLLGLAQGRKADTDLGHIHLGKLAHTGLPTELCELRLLWRAHRDGWLEGPVWVIHYVMSALATRMASHPDLDVPLLTDLQYAESWVVGAPKRRHSTATRRLRALSELLPVGPDVELDEILRFREQHQRELRDFRTYLEALLSDVAVGNERELGFNARLRHATEVRQHLVRELDTLTNNAPYLPIALSLTSIAAPAVENAYYSMSAGVLGLAYLLYNQHSDHRRAREAGRNSLVYAALASNRFSHP